MAEIIEIVDDDEAPKIFDLTRDSTGGCVDLCGESDESDDGFEMVSPPPTKKRKVEGGFGASPSRRASPRRRPTAPNQGTRARPAAAPSPAAESPATRAAREEAKTFSTPAGMAMRLVEALRDCGRDGLESKNTAVNFDHAVKFLETHERFLANCAVAKSGPRRGRRHTPLAIVYHGTSRANFRKIMDGNLAVPDGRAVKHATDDGYFGRGIYTTTRHELAFAYAKDAIVFACLALPGKMHKATQKNDRGRPKRPGCDSHLGYENDGCPQLVFFDSSQILPCYLVDRSNHPRAKTALERAVRTIAEATGNARPGDGIPTNSLLAAGASFLDVAATPFVAPFTDAKL